MASLLYLFAQECEVLFPYRHNLSFRFSAPLTQGEPGFAALTGVSQYSFAFVFPTPVFPGLSLFVSTGMAMYTDEMVGTSYQFSDIVDQGRRYYYWLELVKTQGTELLDPVAVDTDYLIRLPLVRR